MLSSDSDDEMYTLSAMHNIQPQRYKRRCPLPGCEKRRSLTRLSNHIREYHKIKSGEERRKWLTKAKVKCLAVHTMLLLLI